ncbi:hypothetical protein BC941DRAFT_439618 [Chlamydoabsidia padenii]|nr:hypothetical protein BC941DRAFT_439618 [Chlamydoabsidia padenii]
MLKHSTITHSKPIQRCFHTQSILYQRHHQHKQQHYDILQVHRHSDKKAIKSQYYRLSKRYHPDLNPTDKEAHEKFLQVNDAYAVLGNEASRRQYDMELDRFSPTSTTTGGSGLSSKMRQPSSMYYGATRPGYTGPSAAWRAKAKQPKNTGSASARAQAEQQQSSSSPHFNHQEHYEKHYQAEELRRRERVINAAKRRKEAGLVDEDNPDGGVNNSRNRLNVWSRLWRLGILLVGISYVTRQLFEYEDNQKKKKHTDKSGFLVE